MITGICLFIKSNAGTSILVGVSIVAALLCDPKQDTYCPGHCGLRFLAQIYLSPYSQTWSIYFPQPSLKVHLNQLFPLTIRPSPSLYNSISPTFFYFPHLTGVKRGITQSHAAGRNTPRVLYMFYSLLSVFFLYILIVFFLTIPPEIIT